MMFSQYFYFELFYADLCFLDVTHIRNQCNFLWGICKYEKCPEILQKFKLKLKGKKFQNQGGWRDGNPGKLTSPPSPHCKRAMPSVQYLIPLPALGTHLHALLPCACEARL